MINEIEHDDDSEMSMAIKSVGEDPRHWEGTVIIIHTSMIIGFIALIFALTATQFLEKMISGCIFALGLSGWLIGTYYFIHHEDPESKHNELTREYIKVLRWHFNFCKDLEGQDHHRWQPIPPPRLTKSD